MNWLRAFWRQESTAYRNFQIAFTLLTLNFALPTLSYAFTPDAAISQFGQLNVLLGGITYDRPENQAYFWRFLGIANVAALAFMCAFLQWDLRRNHRVVVPLTFLKATAATAWLVGYIQHPEYPAFLAAAILDYVTSGAFVFFVSRAMADIDDRDDGVLRPIPGQSRGDHWSQTERRWGQSLFEAMLPSGAEHSGFSAVDRDDFWRRLGDRAPSDVKLGLRASIWLLNLWPILIASSFKPFSRLGPDRQQAVLEAAANSRFYAVREAVELVKMLACFGFFGDADVRGQFGGVSS